MRKQKLAQNSRLLDSELLVLGAAVLALGGALTSASMPAVASSSFSLIAMVTHSQALHAHNSKVYPEASEHQAG